MRSGVGCRWRSLAAVLQAASATARGRRLCRRNRAIVFSPDRLHGWRSSRAWSAGRCITEIETGVPMGVTVTEDAASGGQIWTRICARTRGSSRKSSTPRNASQDPPASRICRADGISMSHCGSRSSAKRWCFVASHYPPQAGSLRMVLPSWLTPGDLTVTHSDLGGGVSPLARSKSLSALRQAYSPVRCVPGGRIMTTFLSCTLIAIQIVMGVLRHLLSP